MNATSDRRSVVLLCDQAGRVERVLRDDLGLSARLYSGSHVSELVGPDARGKLDAFLAELRGGQAACAGEMTVPVGEARVPLHFAGTRLEGSCLVVAVSAGDGLVRLEEERTRINRDGAADAGGRAHAAVGREDSLYGEMSRLNNELVNVYREMAKKNVELAAANEQKNRLLGMAAHDLRSPLGIIQSYAEFLETEAAAVLNDEQRDFVATIKSTSEFMLRMVSEILDVTAIEAGQLRLDLQPVDLPGLIGRNVALNRVLAAKKAIAIDFDPPAGFPLLSLDAPKIEQVMNNLLGNAIKFSHRGTRVQVCMSCTQEMATVAVRDQGLGIPEGDLAKLFKPFGKASVRGTGGEQSTGLGLAIVRKMIEGHGGRIWVESAVGRGSTFFFTLPIQAAGPAAAKVASPADLRPGDPPEKPGGTSLSKSAEACEEA